MNLITTPQKWDNCALIFKSETTYGVDPTPTGAANWIEMRNVNYVPMDVVYVSRDLVMPWMGNTGELIESVFAKLSFDVALAGSGVAGTAPKVGPLLLASGLAETITAATSVAYNLISSAFGSATGYMNCDGVRQKLLGIRGNAKLTIAKGKPPMISFNFDALFTLPTSTVMPSVTRTGWPLEESVNASNTGPLTINGVDCAFQSFEVDLGQKIFRRDLPGPQLEIAISGRTPSASATIMAPDLATFDPFTLAKNGTVIDVSCTHGSAAGKKAKVDLKAKLKAPSRVAIERDTGYKIDFEPDPVAGNDEIVLTFL